MGQRLWVGARRGSCGGFDVVAGLSQLDGRISREDREGAKMREDVLPTGKLNILSPQLLIQTDLKMRLCRLPHFALLRPFANFA